VSNATPAHVRVTLAEEERAPDYWRDRLVAIGVNLTSAELWSYHLARVSRLLADRCGTDLAHCDRADLEAVAAAGPAKTLASWRQMRSALNKVPRLLGRGPLPLEVFIQPAKAAREEPAPQEQLRTAFWAQQLVGAGVKEKTAQVYGFAVARIERLLGEQRGASLATCDAEDLAAVAASLPMTFASRRQFRSALARVAPLVGREAFPLEALPAPSVPVSVDFKTLTIEEAEQLERTAWAVGGPQGLAALIALHTHLGSSEISVMTWPMVDLDRAVIVRPGGDIALTPRLRRAFAEYRQGRSGHGFVFTKSDGHVTALGLMGYVRFVANLAGFPHAGPRVLQHSSPGEVDVDAAKQLVITKSDGMAWAGGRAGRVGVDELMSTGISERTARVYVSVLRRIIALLDEQDTDLETCTGAHLVNVARCFPNTNSSRSQLRGALKRAWEFLGREHPPSLTAIRLPPSPRARSKALQPDVARTLEQAAWDRDDLPGLAVLVGLYSALRRAEIASLSWERIEFDPTTGRPMWMRVTGKGDVTADVPVHPVLADALLRFKRGRGWVFPGRDPGTHVNPSTVWIWVKQVAEEAGLSDIYTHLLRHTALTEANDASNDLRTVQEIARHSRPEITSIYTRVTGARMLDVVASINYGRRSGHEPDPADTLPGLTYRQAVTAIEEGEERADAWVTLGLALHPAGWRFEATEGCCCRWVHPDRPDLTATASVRHSVAEFTLFCQHDDDTAETWDFDRPELVAALAEALSAGIPAPTPTHRLGPWIEKPFVQLLRGEEPDWSALRGPLVALP
jgi:integrase/recombinase XerD